MNKKIVLSMLAVVTIASSCSVTKRTYSDGYHVEWYHRDHKPEKTTTSQKAIPEEVTIEVASVNESPLIPTEEHTPRVNDIESAPLKENKRAIADRSNTMLHPAPLVKNSFQQITKQVVKVKENSNNKAMGILSSLVVVLLALVVLVLIIFVISILL